MAASPTGPSPAASASTPGSRRAPRAGADHFHRNPRPRVTLHLQQRSSVMSGVSIIGAIVIGILAGWIAEQVMGREHGLVTNLVVGVVGAFLGAFVASLLGIGYTGFWASLA